MFVDSAQASQQHSPDEAVIEFAGRVERMAQEYHFGLRDQPSIHSKNVHYVRATIVGFQPGRYMSINHKNKKYLTFEFSHTVINHINMLNVNYDLI
ncbi:hypothetical protein [Yersinia aldovae]|uniref:hypothetical protein n=1 Tax=Yersinia aldovae TaxID=29483 RepID=UPI0021BD76B6|nr:hypothetical protein [Yersinia aldovae]